MHYWYPLGRLRGIHAALYVHISVVIAFALIALAAVRDPAFAIATLLSLLGLILLHEVGHATVARHLGYATRSIRLSLIHGRCEYDAPPNRWDETLIAWGGVAAQLLIAVPLCIFDAFWRYPLGLFAPVILVLGYWSLIVVVFNLIPTRGLDGWTAWQIIPLLRTRPNARRTSRSAIRKISRRR
jgi:stage IV sporulation protein FB